MTCFTCGKRISPKTEHAHAVITQMYRNDVDLVPDQFFHILCFARFLIHGKRHSDRTRLFVVLWAATEACGQVVDTLIGKR